MSAAIAHAAAFGIVLFVALAAIRAIAPQPHERIGLGRLTFYRLDVSVYAQFVVLPAVLFGIGCSLAGVTWPYSVTLLLASCLAVFCTLLAPIARALTKHFPRAEAAIGVLFFTFSFVLPLSSLLLPYVAAVLTSR